MADKWKTIAEQREMQALHFRELLDKVGRFLGPDVLDGEGKLVYEDIPAAVAKLKVKADGNS